MAALRSHLGWLHADECDVGTVSETCRLIQRYRLHVGVRDMEEGALTSGVNVVHNSGEQPSGQTLPTVVWVSADRAHLDPSRRVEAPSCHGDELVTAADPKIAAELNRRGGEWAWPSQLGKGEHLLDVCGREARDLPAFWNIGGSCLADSVVDQLSGMELGAHSPTGRRSVRSSGEDQSLAERG